MSKQNVPELRLEGFEGDWVADAFGKLIYRSGAASDDPSLPRLEYEDINSGDGTLNKDLFTKNSSKTGLHFKPGDVLYGKLRPYLKNWFLPNFEGIAVGDFWVLQSNEVMAAFLYGLIQTDRFMKVANISSGSKMPRADWSLVSKTQFPFPPNTSEQCAIGTIFTKLDTLIARHKKKLDLLKQTKTSLLQGMFPADGAIVPELRLDGFSGEWKISTLGHEVRLINGRAYSQPELLDSGKYPVLRVGNFYTNTSWYYSDLELGDKYYADNGDLLYTWSASFGPHVWNGGKVIYHYHIWKIELGQRLDRDFLLQLLENDKAAILAGQNGSAMVHVTKEGMEARAICFPPTLEEQRAIGSVFAKLDSLISAEAQYIDKLTQAKAALLQKMFV